MSEHLTAARQLKAALLPRTNGAIEHDFAQETLAENEAFAVRALAMAMSATLRNSDWLAVVRQNLITNFGYAQADHLTDLHIARHARLRERLADPTDTYTIHMLIATTAFEGCVSPQKQVAHMEDLLNAGLRLGVVPNLRPNPHNPAITSVFVFDERDVYTQWHTPSLQDKHQKFYANTPELAGEYTATFNEALRHAQPIERALHDLRRYGEVQKDTYANA